MSKLWGVVNPLLQEMSLLCTSRKRWDLREPGGLGEETQVSWPGRVSSGTSWPQAQPTLQEALPCSYSWPQGNQWGLPGGGAASTKPGCLSYMCLSRIWSLAA